MANHNTYRGNTIETIKPLLKLKTAPAKKNSSFYFSYANT